MSFPIDVHSTKLMIVDVLFIYDRNEPAGWLVGWLAVSTSYTTYKAMLLLARL